MALGYILENFEWNGRQIFEKANILCAASQVETDYLNVTEGDNLIFNLNLVQLMTKS
jgi:hypothetical protein